MTTTRKTAAKTAAEKDDAKAAEQAAGTANAAAPAVSTVEQVTTPAPAVSMVEPEAESEPITVEWYEVITACDETRVSRIAIRDTPEVTEGNLALTVPVGTELKAVEDLGEFTRLTHDLYVMSKYVKPL